MKSRDNGYIFLLTIIVVGLIGGLFLKPKNEGFTIMGAVPASIKEYYNSILRKFRTYFERKREGMNNYSYGFDRYPRLFFER
jgi:hypothetical protein